MRVLLLGYGPDRSGLAATLAGWGHDVTHSEAPIADLSPFDRVVSFGYRHILRADVLATAAAPPLNLHVSLLPWNRGAHPNFWAWAEGTPHGVTLHEIDPGLDTGGIVAQRETPLDPGRSLRASHARLLAEIEALFADAGPDWLAGRAPARPQPPGGSYHALKDLPAWVDWDMTGAEVRERTRHG